MVRGISPEAAGHLDHVHPPCTHCGTMSHNELRKGLFHKTRVSVNAIHPIGTWENDLCTQKWCGVPRYFQKYYPSCLYC